MKNKNGVINKFSTSEQMAARLEEAYRHPDRKFCYYSANSKPSGSSRLDRLSFWDWTPYPSDRPQVGTSTFPQIFGAPRIEIANGKEWVKPFISDPDQVAQIEIPDLLSGRSGQILDEVSRLKNADPGVQIRCCDIQSPLGIAELMWDEDFYIALIESPDAVHCLLDKITEFLIQFMREYQARAGERYNPCGFPLVWSRGTGTMVADDTLSLLSPAMHEEFSLPYLNCIAEAVGPLYYHSCSWYTSHLDNIQQVKNVVSYNWNPGNSEDPAVLFPKFSGRAVLALHLCKDMHRDSDVLRWGKNFSDEAEFFEYHLDQMTDNTCLYWWFSNILEKPEIIERIYDLLNERGYTPEACGLI